MREQAIIIALTPVSILVEDDYGDTFPVLKGLVTGEPRVGATVTLVKGGMGLRAFVEPKEKPARILSTPDESGVQIISRHISEVLRAVGE
jgi:hypothetical protein